MDTVLIKVCSGINTFTTTTTRDIMCNCGSAELYRIFCGRHDDKYLHRDDSATTISTTSSSNSHNSCYYEVEGSRHFDLVLRYLAAVHNNKQQDEEYESEQKTSEPSLPTRKRKRRKQHQQQHQVDSVMDEICRGGSGGIKGCEVFQAVYRDAQRYELREMMAHMLTKLTV